MRIQVHFTLINMIHYHLIVYWNVILYGINYNKVKSIIRFVHHILIAITFQNIVLLYLKQKINVFNHAMNMFGIKIILLKYVEINAIAMNKNF